MILKKSGLVYKPVMWPSYPTHTALPSPRSQSLHCKLYMQPHLMLTTYPHAYTMIVLCVFLAACSCRGVLAVQVLRDPPSPPGRGWGGAWGQCSYPMHGSVQAGRLMRQQQSPTLGKEQRQVKTTARILLRGLVHGMVRGMVLLWPVHMRGPITGMGRPVVGAVKLMVIGHGSVLSVHGRHVRYA